MNEINTWPTQGWHCVRQLGEGSFGKVYEILRTEFGQEYHAALKVITIPQSQADVESAYSDGLDEKSVTAYFRDIVEDISKEVALMSQLRGHSNIVSYDDHMVLEHEGKLGWDILIRMELLTPLYVWCSGRTLSEEEIIRLGCDICRALELCRRKDIIHRDIKPENIFVNEYGDFKLGDFGIARTVERTMSNLSKKGTYTYMAPEVYLGKAYNQTVDIYSLGVVLYRYLNENRTPFLPQGALKYRDRDEAQRRRMSGEPVPPPCRGSKQLKAVVLKALSFDPKERYQTAQAFRAALESCTVSAESLQKERDSRLDEFPGAYTCLLMDESKLYDIVTDNSLSVPQSAPITQPEPVQPVDAVDTEEEQDGTVDVKRVRQAQEKKAKKRKRPVWAIALAVVLVIVLVAAVFLKNVVEIRIYSRENAALQDYVVSAAEEGLAITSLEIDDNDRVTTIWFNNAAVKMATVSYAYRAPLWLRAITEYDKSGNKIKQTWYDSSGNRTSEKYYSSDGSLSRTVDY